jgi:hypothetical protein
LRLKSRRQRIGKLSDDALAEAIGKILTLLLPC